MSCWCPLDATTLLQRHRIFDRGPIVPIWDAPSNPNCTQGELFINYVLLMTSMQDKAQCMHIWMAKCVGFLRVQRVLYWLKYDKRYKIQFKLTKIFFLWLTGAFMISFHVTSLCFSWLESLITELTRNRNSNQVVSFNVGFHVASFRLFSTNLTSVKE